MKKILKRINGDLYKVALCCCLIISGFNMMAQFGGSQGGSQGGNGRPPGGGSGGNGGGTLPPGGSSIIVYGDMKYTGMSRALGQGSFNAQTLGFLSGNVSSIYVPQGTAITLYDNRGQSRSFTTSVSNLAQYGWDNKAVSGMIQRTGGGNGGGNGWNPGPVRPPKPPAPKAVAQLFTASKYRGQVVPISQGMVPHLGLGADRAISSFQLAPGYALRVFSGLNFTGHYHTFTGSVVNLAPYGWNDMIRSVQILRR